ncbi:MAG: acyl-ACP--UDP-N-acetylglucosamine O-acyltransferase [Deltaproteobacteria bacterium]|nr:acyl-ACP--UDP-N-acetylglucosamine O-acyltransferase [Deltaproteobacteria bacterium]
MNIHPTAVVGPGAQLADGVRVGPYCTIGDHVMIGKNTILISHVVIEGHTRIGEGNTIYPFVSIGSPPQDIGYRGEETYVIIGQDNLIREFTTINRATTKQERRTVVGSENYLMAYSHIAHDCVLGNKIIMGNAATLGGHVQVGDCAIFGGMVAVHQFVRIGSHAFLGGKAGIDRDVPPFMIAAGERAKLYGVNQKGLTRLGWMPEKIAALKKAYRILWRKNRSFHEGVNEVRAEIASFPELEVLLSFLVKSKRGILR